VIGPRLRQDVGKPVVIGVKGGKVGPDGDACSAGQSRHGHGQIGVLLSGRGSNLGALLKAAAAPDYPARIVLVLSDRADARGLGVAAGAGVEARAVPRAAFASRGDFEAALAAALDAAAVEVVCLAGFMRILAPALLAGREGRVLNIHPSLLPAFRGLDTHARALSAGVRIHGATVHIVTEALDEGPIIAQAAVPVVAGDTAESLAARVLAAEHGLYPAALARHLRPPRQEGAPGAPLFSPPLPE